ncbi:MAG: hypothetical protein ABIM99_05135 [Candidatus Dojkabacteria bacterium]
MVAILGEPKIEEFEGETEKENNIDFHSDAIKNGHFNWFIGLLRNGKQFGLTRDVDHHFGMIEFELMNWIAKEFADKEINKEGLLIDNFLSFKEELLFKFGYYFGAFEQNFIPEDYDFPLLDRLAVYKSNFIDTIATATEEDINEWVKKIVSGPRPFYKNNDNWAKTADEFNLVIKNSNNPLNELELIRFNILRLNSKNAFKDISDYLTTDPKGKTLFTLLEDIHGGWRIEVYPSLHGKNVREEYTLNRSEKLLRAVKSLEGLMLGTVRTMNLSTKELENIIYAMINTERRVSEENPELDSHYTFLLIIKIGLILEKLINESIAETKETFIKIRNNLLYDLKKDANIAPVDALIKYYGKN